MPLALGSGIGLQFTGQEQGSGPPAVSLIELESSLSIVLLEDDSGGIELES